MTVFLIYLLWKEKKRSLLFLAVFMGMVLLALDPFNDVISSFWFGLVAALFFAILKLFLQEEKKRTTFTLSIGSFCLAEKIFFVSIDALLAAGCIRWALGLQIQQAHLELRFLAPNWPHLLGTDGLSRDVLLRLLEGGRFSVWVSLAAGGLSTLCGIVIGTAAASFGEKADQAFMRLSEMMLALPALPLLLLLSALPLDAFLVGVPSIYSLSAAGFIAVLSGFCLLKWPYLNAASAAILSVDAIHSKMKKTLQMLFITACIFLGFSLFFYILSKGEKASGAALRIICILAVFSWVRAARLARLEVHVLKKSDLFMASCALGAARLHRWRTLFYPHLLWIFFSVGALECANAFLAEAALSYLGFGAQPPLSSWGRMLLGALEGVHHHPLQTFLPAFCIVGSAFLFQRLGEAWRKALDPSEI